MCGANLVSDKSLRRWVRIFLIYFHKLLLRHCVNALLLYTVLIKHWDVKRW